MVSLGSKVGLTADVKPNARPPVKQSNAPIAVLVVLLVVLSGYIAISWTNTRPAYPSGAVPVEERFPTDVPSDDSGAWDSPGFHVFVLNMTSRTVDMYTTLFTFENRMPLSWWGLDPLCGMVVNGTGDYGTDVRVNEGMTGKRLTFSDSFPTKINSTTIQFYGNPLVVSGSRGWWNWYGEKRDVQSFGMCQVLDDWRNNAWSPDIGVSLTTLNGNVTFTDAKVTVLYNIPTAIPEFGSDIGVLIGAIVIGAVAVVFLRRRRNHI